MLVANSFLSEFSGRRVMLTGHTGFKGSWLAYLLKEAGSEVLGYALPPEYPESHFELLGLNRCIRHIEGDIRDAGKLAETMRDFAPDVVFHLAAQALVKRSYNDPKTTFDTNVGGSVNLLEAVRACASVRSLVFVTSDKCYENVEWVWGYRENDRLGGHDPYSASKAAAEIVFQHIAGHCFLIGQHSVSRVRVPAMLLVEETGPLIASCPIVFAPCVMASQYGCATQLLPGRGSMYWSHWQGICSLRPSC